MFSSLGWGSEGSVGFVADGFSISRIDLSLDSIHELTVSGSGYISPVWKINVKICKNITKHNITMIEI